MNVNFSSRLFLFQLEDGKQIEADALIIATGASVKWLGLDSVKKFIDQGISSCAVCDGFFFQDRTVAVVGGGDTALEDALYLTNYASKVIVIHRRDALKASKYLQYRAFANEKIHFVWNSQIEEILEDCGNLAGLKIKNAITNERGQIDCEGLFVAIGHQPNTQLFAGKINLDATGYIITKPHSTQTSIPGVFATGDVADPHYPPSCDYSKNRLHGRHGCLSFYSRIRYGKIMKNI